MLLKWAIVILLGYFIYKKFIALPPGKEEDDRLNIKDKTDTRRGGDEDDYIDFEEVD